jgi:RNA-binding protein YlmH
LKKSILAEEASWEERTIYFASHAVAFVLRTLLPASRRKQRRGVAAFGIVVNWKTVSV